MQDNINPKTEGLVLNLRATNPNVDAVRSTPTQSQNIDVNKLFGERTSTHFTNTSILDTHEKLFDGTWVPKYENFDPTKSTQENAERLAQQQGRGDKWANGWTKFFGKTGTAVLGGTVGSVNAFSEFMSTGSMQAIYDNDFSKRLSDLDTKLTYNNPNHKSQEEQDMNFLQAMGTANWWADDLLGGISFTVGTVISEGAWALATGGTSVSTAFTRIGASLASRAALKKGVKSLVKPSFKKAVKKADDLGELAINANIRPTVTGGIIGGTLGELANTARFTITSAGWESSFESLSYLKEGMQSFDSNFYADNGRMPTFEERQKYLDRLYDGANSVFFGNMVLVGASNLAIIGKAFDIKMPGAFRSMDRAINRRLFGIGLDDTGQALIKATRAQKIAGGMYGWLRPAVMEGMVEEGGQSVLSSAISDYAYAPFNPEYLDGSLSMTEAFANSFEDTFTTKEGWKEIWTGMVIGIIGDKGSNLIAGRGLKSGISQAREQAQTMAEFNKSYSIDNLSESLFYANRVQDSNKDEGAGSPEVTALKRRAGILAQLTQAHNTGMYSDIVDDTVTGIGLLDANALSEELGITVEEANQMKQDAITEYQSLAKEFSRNKKFVDYYFGDNIRGQKPTQSRLMKDAIAFIMTNGQESYNESRTVLEQLKQGLAKTIPGLDVNSTLSMFDNIAHMTDANRVEFNKVTEQLKEVLENIGATTTEIANLAQKDVSTIDSNLIADEANILTEKLNNLESEKKRLEQEANRLASLSALNNPYYKEEDGVQYMRAEDIATLEENIKTIEEQINEASDSISNTESLVELLHGYQDHLLAYKEYAEVSSGIISGNLDLSSKKSLVGKIFGPKEYNKQEERFVRAVLGRAGMNLDQYMQDMLGLTRVINQAKKATDVTEVKGEVTKTTESTLQELINNSPYLREKFSGEDGPRKLQEAMFSQQLKVEFSNLIDKANGDKSFDGRYESIDDNTSLTSAEKARLKDLMEQFGAVAIGEGFQQTGVTLTDLLVQMNQGNIKAGEDTGTMTKADFSEMMDDQTEETTGARNEEIAQTPTNVQVSKKGSTTVIHNLTLKGLLNKLGVYVVDDTTSPRSNRGVPTEDLSNDKGTKVRFAVGDSVINARVNNRGAIELTSEKRGDNVLGIISANSNLTVAKYAHGTNNKYSFMFEDGRPMKSDFQLTPRYSEEAIYNAKGGDYVRFEVDINDPYNQSIQDLSFEEKVKLVKIYIVDSAGNVLGELKALEDVYGIENFNILREEAATVYENGGGFVGYEAPIKTVLLGMPNMTLDADGNPQAATTTHESVVDWGYMQDGKFVLKNKTEPANIRRDFVQRIKGKSRVPVAVIRFGSQTMAIPVAVRGEASNKGNEHKEALELDNENTAKKVIDLNADLIARGSSDRFYFNSPTDQNVYKTDGSLTDRVMEAIDFLNKYQDTPDISTMSKENAMSQIDSPVNFDSKPFISPKVIMNLGKMSKVGERTPEVTAEVAATEKASKEAESVVEEEVVTEETANLEYKETRFGDNTLVNHVRSGTPYTYQGLDGHLDTDGQRLIFTAGNQEFDLGYAPDLTLQELKEMGLERTEAMSVEIREDGVIVFDGVEYTQEPGVESVIEDGDERYVTLKAPNGNFVTFQGDKADAIVYNMKKQEFTDKNITDEQGKEIAKQTREARVTKRTRQTAPKAEDTDTKSSVVVTTTKKEAKEVVEELKPIDGTLEEVSVKEAPKKKGRKTKETAPKGVDDVAKGTTVTHKGKNKKVKSVTKNADGTVKRIELEDGTRLGSTTQPAEQTTNPVSVILNRLKLSVLATAVYEVATEQLNKLLGQRTNTPIRNQLPLMNKEDLGEAFATGTETVARRQGDKVYKTYSIDAASMYENEAEFVESMEALNAEFPETGTKIVGKTIDGEYVVEQNYIDGVAPTKEALDQAMRDKGFVYEEGTWKKNGREFDDITPDNAYVTADGTVVVYDANVYRGEDFDARYQIAGLTPNREVQVYITPATIRNFNEETLRLKELTDEYSNLAKEIAQGNLENQEEFTNLQHRILDSYQEHIQDKVSKIRGVNVSFNQPYLGSWQGSYEPSLNMTLSISPDADTGAISGLLYDIAENTSQDSFILEEGSEIEGRTPLTEFDEAGIMHYPQIRVNFDRQLSVEEKSIVAQRLNNNGVEDFSIDGDYFIVSIIDENSETNEQKEQYYAEKAAAITSPFTGEGEKIGTNRLRDVQRHIRKSRYVGARNDGDAQSQTREYDRSDLFEERVEENNSENTQDFFSEVQEGKHAPNRPFQPELQLTKEEQEVYDLWKKYEDNFDRHIETSIPIFREVQIKKMLAIAKMLKNGGRVIDLGGSTGSFVKTITELNNKIRTYNLDANEEMQRGHEATPVEGSEFIREAFQEAFGEYERHIPKEKYDVVHESMLFQFISKERRAFFKEVVDNYLKGDGVFIVEEKMLNDNYEANEVKKDRDFKSKYYTQEQVENKKTTVLTGMTGGQAHQAQVESLLKEEFKYVEQYWDSGNFKGYIATNSKEKLDQFLNDMGDTTSEFSTNFQTNATEQTVVTDLSGNQTEVDSSNIVTYESEAGPIHYIIDSNGDMQMVRLEEQAVPEAVSEDLLRGEELSPSPISSTEQELEQIKAQAIANGTFMKAPNGKDTNLNERQWLQVRSKAFTDWFGDWQNDPQNASKVVDENGEPLVVWHGTEMGFTEFKNTYNKNMRGFYFSSSRSVASTYGDEKSLFLKIIKPYYIDAKGKRFTDDLQVEVELSYPGESPYNSNMDMAVDDIVRAVRDGKPKNGFYQIKDSSTYDGVVVKNIIDPSLSSSIEEVADDYITFDSNQIKSATDNVGTYSNESNDIRHQRLDKVAVKGAVTGSNEVFINTDLATPDTPIHEFSHLYNTWLQQNRPELWNKGKSLVEAELNKTDSEIKDVIDYVRSTQPALSGDALIDEILAELVGRRGQALIESKSTTGLAGWLKEVWAEIANMLGLSQMSAEQVSKLTIMEYADAMSIDLLSGRDLKKQKRFTVKPKVTSTDTRVNRTTRPTNPATEQLFSENRKFSKAEAPTITTSTISEYNVFMTMEDKIKSVKLLEFNKNTGRGKVFVTFTNANIPSAQYSNVSFDRREISELGFEGALPEGVDMSESGPFTAYHFREAFINTDENNVKNYFTNLVENENIIKFADEITMYRFSDGQLRAPNGELTDMDYSRPFTLTKEDRNSPKAIRKQNILNISETLTRESRTEQNRDC